MKRIAYVNVLLLLVITSGCATGKRFTTAKSPREHTSIVYVFRPGGPPYLLRPAILVNGIKAADLASKGYIELEVPPGTYTIDADWSFVSGVRDRSITLKTEPQKSYYVVLNSEQYVMTIYCSLELVHPDYAVPEMADCCSAIPLRAGLEARTSGR